MVSRSVSGTEGYADEAGTLGKQYESVSFTEVHGQIADLIPSDPCRILDIGAGTGRDAAALAAMGHRVVAMEPTAELRKQAAALHPSPLIEWLDDSLPDLETLSARGDRFDVVMLTAVWMHLDADQRRRAMPRVANLVRGGGLMTLSLRYGPVPAGRRMFEVSADETIRLAEIAGLELAVKLERQPSLFGRKNVQFTRLAFIKST